MYYRTIEEIMAANRRVGQDWFAPSALSHLSVLVYPTVSGGQYFITSSQHPLPVIWQARGMKEFPRKWTIHICNPEGWVDNYGEWQQYSTLHQALVHVETLPPARLYQKDQEEITLPNLEAISSDKADEIIERDIRKNSAVRPRTNTPGTYRKKNGSQ